MISTGGRFHFEDDWEFPDTQEATFEFAGGKTIIWQGQSCNGLPMYGRSRGTMILGTNGSVVIDQDGYVISDLKNKVVKESVAAAKGDRLNTVGDDSLTELHMRQLPRRDSHRREAQRSDRGRREDRDALSPRHYRAPDGPKAQDRPGHGPDPGGQGRDASMVANVRA